MVHGVYLGTILRRGGTRTCSRRTRVRRCRRKCEPPVTEPVCWAPDDAMTSSTLATPARALQQQRPRSPAELPEQLTWRLVAPPWSSAPTCLHFELRALDTVVTRLQAVLHPGGVAEILAVTTGVAFRRRGEAIGRRFPMAVPAGHHRPPRSSHLITDLGAPLTHTAAAMRAGLAARALALAHEALARPDGVQQAGAGAAAAAAAAAACGCSWAVLTCKPELVALYGGRCGYVVLDGGPSEAAQRFGVHLGRSTYADHQQGTMVVMARTLS
jgi:hypothetical protein